MGKSKRAVECMFYRAKTKTILPTKNTLFNMIYNEIIKGNCVYKEDNDDCIIKVTLFAKMKITGEDLEKTSKKFAKGGAKLKLYNITNYHNDQDADGEYKAISFIITKNKNAFPKMLSFEEAARRWDEKVYNIYQRQYDEDEASEEELEPVDVGNKDDAEAYGELDSLAKIPKPKTVPEFPYTATNWIISKAQFDYFVKKVGYYKNNVLTSNMPLINYADGEWVKDHTLEESDFIRETGLKRIMLQDGVNVICPAIKLKQKFTVHSVYYGFDIPPRYCLVTE